MALPDVKSLSTEDLDALLVAVSPERAKREPAVVPWRRRRGHATQALRDLLPEVRKEGLAWVELTTDPSNVASQRVIAANGGVLVERFVKPAQYGFAEGLRLRIALR